MSGQGPKVKLSQLRLFVQQRGHRSGRQFSQQRDVFKSSQRNLVKRMLGGRLVMLKHVIWVRIVEI